MYTSEGTLVSWLFPDGAQVQMGDAIAEIETEKATNEIPAPASGVLRHAAAVGTLLKEQGVMGYILAEGETQSTEMVSESRVSGPESPAFAPNDPARFGEASSELVASGNGTTSAVGQLPDGWIKTTPLARRIAREHGIDLSSVRPSGPGGRIVEADVRAVLSSPPRPVSQSASPENAALPAVRSRAKLTPMRLTIGERLKRAQSNAASLTLTREVSADLLAAARTRAQARWPRLSFDALFVKLLAAALQGHPLNGAIDDRDNALVLFEDVHVGVAVAVAEGLLAPVVRRANAASLGDIEARIREAADRARTNALTSDDLVGGTTTISNLGGAGIDAFTPILNPPQASILGIGRIQPRPVVQNGNLIVGLTCVLSLTFDHRVCDGVPAAQVLDRIATMMNDDAQLDRLIQ